MGQEKVAAEQKKRRMRIWIPALCLLAFIAAFLILRAFRWSQEGESASLLTLIDEEHTVEDSYSVEFTLLGDGQMLDSRCVDDYEAMIAACVQAGGRPELRASFRTSDAQAEVYEQALAALIDQGMSREWAEQVLQKQEEKPGLSEHQLGLAVDLFEEGSELAPEEQGDTFTLRWLRENAWRYGFVLRYPEGKSEQTGKDYRPWHFRYVGVSAAAQMHELDLTLEEYVRMFYS